MEKSDLYGLVISGLLGALTNIFHGLSINMKYKPKELFIRFIISVLAIFPAYLFCEYMDLSRILVFIVAYICGALGDRLINEIYRRENNIYSFFVGSIGEGMNNDINKKEQEKL